MQLDECIKLPAPRAEIERAMRLSLRWAERSQARLRGAPSGPRAVRHRAGRRRSGAARRERARARSTSAFDGYAIGGLAVGEPPEVMLRDDRGGRAGAAGRPAALSDGRRHAGRSPRGGRARHRHVRLRAADPQRPPRRRLHALRADHPQERAPRRRSAPARRGEPLPGGARLFARLSASSGQGRRDARRHPAVARSISPITRN